MSGDEAEALRRGMLKLQVAREQHRAATEAARHARLLADRLSAASNDRLQEVALLVPCPTCDSGVGLDCLDVGKHGMKARPAHPLRRELTGAHGERRRLDAARVLDRNRT